MIALPDPIKWFGWTGAFSAPSVTSGNGSGTGPCPWDSGVEDIQCGSGFGLSGGDGVSLQMIGDQITFGYLCVVGQGAA